MDESAVNNLVVLSVAMALSAAIPALLPRVLLPGAVLEIILGAVVGPQILGLAHPGAVLDFLADFGLGLLFLMMGFEMNLPALRGRPIRNAAASWAISGVVALYAGFVLFVTGRVQAPVLTALALCTTSIGLLIPMLRDSKLVDPPYGPMVLAAGAVGEGAPLFILPIVVAHQGGMGPQALIMAAFAASGAFASLRLTRVVAISRRLWIGRW